MSKHARMGLKARLELSVTMIKQSRGELQAPLEAIAYIQHTIAEVDVGKHLCIGSCIPS